MTNVLKVSEAASLAMHSMVFLKENASRVISTRELSEALNASGNHLSKVMQRLTRENLVKPVRGPKGGFTLSKKADKITLLDIFEAMEGSLAPLNCLLKKPVCRGKACILGGLLKNVNNQVKDYLTRTKLSDLKGVYKINEEKRKTD